MSTGVIYGVHIEKAETAGPMSSGPVITFCARLPEWCVLDGPTETALRLKLHEAMSEAIEVATDSEKSKARRLEQQMGRTK